MLEDDEYQTISTVQKAQLTVKGSRFIGHAAPVFSAEAAVDYIQKISKEYFDATHNCFAYRIGVGKILIERHSDAGEPAGTAGIPIFQAIENLQLTNLVVIITRYFGGTKLGTGGLVRAYREATLKTLLNAPMIKDYIYSHLRLEFPYPLTGEVMHLLQSFAAKIERTDYSDRAKIIFSIRQSRKLKFVSKLNELAHLNIKVFENE
ncbi:YigZ family protein [candidate division KSB1 bacterium]|nr:YigZ family protein [candidate division KSB1 bacterium]